MPADQRRALVSALVVAVFDSHPEALRVQGETWNVEGETSRHGVSAEARHGENAVVAGSNGRTAVARSPEPRLGTTAENLAKSGENLAQSGEKQPIDPRAARIRSVLQMYEPKL